MESTVPPNEEIVDVATSPSEGNFSPLPPAHRPWDTKKMIFGITIIIAILIPVAAFFTYTQRQTTQSDARTPQQCVIKVKPIRGVTCPSPNDLARDQSCGEIGPLVAVQCRDQSIWCTEQGSTFDVCGDNCKRISTCSLKCRTTDKSGQGGSEYWVNECEKEPTPVPQKTQLCVEPNKCMDAATAKASGCVIDPTNVGGAQQCQLSGSSTDVGYCCTPKELPTPTPTPTKTFPTPTDKPTPTPTPTEIPTPTPTLPPDVTPTATPPITQACILPVIDVTVECAVCGAN